MFLFERLAEKTSGVRRGVSQRGPLKMSQYWINRMVKRSDGSLLPAGPGGTGLRFVGSVPAEDTMMYQSPYETQQRYGMLGYGQVGTPFQSETYSNPYEDPDYYGMMYQAPAPQAPAPQAPAPEPRQRERSQRERSQRERSQPLIEFTEEEEAGPVENSIRQVSDIRRPAFGNTRGTGGALRTAQGTITPGQPSPSPQVAQAPVPRPSQRPSSPIPEGYGRPRPSQPRTTERPQSRPRPSARDSK